DPARLDAHDPRAARDHLGFRDPHLRPGGDEPAAYLRRLLRGDPLRALPGGAPDPAALRRAAPAARDAAHGARARHDLPAHLQRRGEAGPCHNAGDLDPDRLRHDVLARPVFPQLPSPLRLQVPPSRRGRLPHRLHVHASRLRGQRRPPLGLTRAGRLPALGVRPHRAHHFFRGLPGRDARPSGGDEPHHPRGTDTGPQVLRTRSTRLGGLVGPPGLREGPREQPPLLRRAALDAVRGHRPHRLRVARLGALLRGVVPGLPALRPRKGAGAGLARPVGVPGHRRVPDPAEHLQHRRRGPARHGPRRRLRPDDPRGRDGLRLLRDSQRARAPRGDGRPARLSRFRLPGDEDSPARRGRRLQAPRLRADGDVRHPDPRHRWRGYEGHTAHRHHAPLRLLRGLLGGRQLYPHGPPAPHLRAGRAARGGGLL
ncbi:MAG: FtsW-like cell division membrane protein CA_C0505, partial [uncultured Rubrobacteraceae bacterium]